MPKPMNDFTAKPSSAALVVAENKAHRPGGCVGVFVKLFDWNRRFGNNKYLPKKLLAPARVNQLSKKFNVDEKLLMPKQRLIADGKGVLFPAMGNNNVEASGYVSSEQTHDTKSPGLVARLMGLDSMPLVAESRNPDQSSDYGKFDTEVGRFPRGLDDYDKEVLNLEKGCMWHELQPQKIQKTGLSERRPVSRFGADALHIRNVLSSRLRKCHPKLVSPVKSLRVARSSSRLTGAVARILEPSLQARSRAKCCLTYSNAKMDEVIGEERMIINLPTQSSYHVCNCHSFKEQSSCRNCGHFRESDQISETTLSMQNGMYNEKESHVVLLRSRHKPGQREAVSPQNQWNFSNMSSFHPERVQSPSKSQPQMLNSGDNVPLRSRRVSSSRALNQKKDFIALNRNMTPSCIRFPRKPGNSTEVQMQYSVQKSNALPMQRDFVRRTTDTCKQAVSTGSFRLSMDRNRSNKSSVVTGNKVSINSANPTCIRTRSCAEGGNGVSQSKDIDVVSFTFSSPLKFKSSSCSPTQVDDKGMNQSNFRNNDDICWPKLVDEDTHGEKASNSILMKEDAIGALLEQTLKELTHQAEYESRTGIIPQGRTTASILQELIAALTADRPKSPITNDNLSSATSVMDSTSQGETRAKRSSLRFSVDRLSPVSVFDASFSNDSCVSSIRDDASGLLQHDTIYMDLLHSNADLLDSASSTITNENNSYKILTVTHLLDHISSLLQRANLSNNYNIVLVLLNAEMLFGNVGHSNRFVDFLVGPFLDELQTLAVAAWRSTVILGFDVLLEGGDERNPLRTFLFDCLIECFDLRYSRYSDCGFKELSKLPTQRNTEILVQVFDYDVRKWASLAMMSIDEVIDWEMSTSLGKWTDLDVEAFESAAEIGHVIFQNLIEEVVADFLW